MSLQLLFGTQHQKALYCAVRVSRQTLTKTWRENRYVMLGTNIHYLTFGFIAYKGKKKKSFQAANTEEWQTWWFPEGSESKSRHGLWAPWCEVIMGLANSLKNYTEGIWYESDLAVIVWTRCLPEWLLKVWLCKWIGGCRALKYRCNCIGNSILQNTSLGICSNLKTKGS